MSKSNWKIILLTVAVMGIFPLELSRGGEARAQTIDVKDLNSAHGESSESTTIEIRQGAAAESQKGANWELAEGTVDIRGEGAPMNREAKKQWKKACNDWQVEFRRDNSENKIIAISCGTPTCPSEAGTTTCSSTATYKIKAKLN